MKGRTGEGVVAVVVALFLFAGVALDTWGPKVSTDLTAAAGDAAFSARAVFCPPALGKPASRMTITAAGRGDENVTVGVEPASSERTDLAPDSILVHKPPSAEPADVVGYGGLVDATIVTSIDEPVEGVGAATCAAEASSRWYFPEGNGTITHDQRMLIYNPFPDEAVVRIALLTPGGERTKAGLSDIPVPSQDAIAVELADFVVDQKILGSVVSSVRGRVVAWRLSIAKPEEKPSGVQFTLGTTALSDVWYFPEGALGEGYEERLAIMNPGSEEATVDVSIVTSSRTIPAAGLTDLAVPARSTLPVVLDPAVLPGESGGAGVVVTSVNGVNIAAERTVFYATEEADGVASEIGARSPSSRWLLGPATSRPETDSAVMLNPGRRAVEVTLTLLRPDGEALRPRTLRGLRIPSGARLRVPLSGATRGEGMAVLVDADGPIVAERFSYSKGAGDVASVMGISLDEIGAGRTP